MLFSAKELTKSAGSSRQGTRLRADSGSPPKTVVQMLFSAKELTKSTGSSRQGTRLRVDSGSPPEIPDFFNIS